MIAYNSPLDRAASSIEKCVTVFLEKITDH